MQETKMGCAVRETYEEIGLDLAGLLKEEDYIEVTHGVWLCVVVYVCGGVCAWMCVVSHELLRTAGHARLVRPQKSLTVC
jgi:8-oxo-dGTP pyrophosphatase MutT (NUDIX family)